MFVTTENPVPLPSRSQIRQIRAESGPGQISNHDTGIAIYVALLKWNYIGEMCSIGVEFSLQLS